MAKVNNNIYKFLIINFLFSEIFQVQKTLDDKRSVYILEELYSTFFSESAEQNQENRNAGI